jgi:hypothetical protein
VEVAGIEPASFGLSTGLLRAQPMGGISAPHPASAPVVEPSSPLDVPVSRWALLIR